MMRLSNAVLSKLMNQATFQPTQHASDDVSAHLELVCPAGSLPALKAAVDHGADCVYLGFKDMTNARNFAGLNFDDNAIAQGIRHAHDNNAKVFVALNTYPHPTTGKRGVPPLTGRLTLALMP